MKITTKGGDKDEEMDDIPALAGVLVIGGVAMAGNAGHSLAATPKGLLTMEEAEAIAVKSVDGKVTRLNWIVKNLETSMK